MRQQEHKQRRVEISSQVPGEAAMKSSLADPLFFLVQRSTRWHSKKHVLQNNLAHRTIDPMTPKAFGVNFGSSGYFCHRCPGFALAALAKRSALLDLSTCIYHFLCSPFTSHMFVDEQIRTVFGGGQLVFSCFCGKKILRSSKQWHQAFFLRGTEVLF